MIILNKLSRLMIPRLLLCPCLSLWISNSLFVAANPTVFYVGGVLSNNESERHFKDIIDVSHIFFTNNQSILSRPQFYI